MTFSFDRSILIHTHIEKTAGSTLVRGLARALGPDRVYDLRVVANPRLPTLTAEAKRNIYVLTGHFHYGTQDQYFDRKKVYIACVRQPLDRLRSYFNFVRTRPNHPGYSALVDKKFSELVQDIIAGRSLRVNGMSRALSGVARPSKEDLLNHVERNYAIVTPHHRVNDTLRELASLLGTRFRRDLHRNKSDEDAADDVGSLEANFNAVSGLDNELYQYVSERYDAWLADLPQRLERGTAEAS